jgi:survival of motor neuron protein-interacting protein 1
LRLDSIIATLKTIVQYQQAKKKKGRNSSFYSVRNNLISDGILPPLKINTRIKEVNFFEGQKMGYNVVLLKVELSTFNGEFGEIIESSDDKMQEVENYMDDGLKKGEIEWNVDDVKEVKEKGKDFVRNECLDSKMGLGTNDNT